MTNPTEDTKEGTTPASAAEHERRNYIADMEDSLRQIAIIVGCNTSHSNVENVIARVRALATSPVDPAPASAVPAAKPAAWMNPRESFAPKAFIWNADERHPEYSVAVYASAPVAPGVAQDAARLDWMEQHWFYRQGDGCLAFGFNETWDAGNHPNLRAAIDAAMSVAPNKKGSQ